LKLVKIAVVLLVIGGLLTTVAFVMAFTTAEVQRHTSTITLPEKPDTVFMAIDHTEEGFVYPRPWFSQKIFYFHVPVGLASFLVFGVAAFFSIRFLMTRRREYDTKSRIAMETTLVFVVLTMITGVIWTRAAWGVWWQWEPRLTTYFIMTLMIIAYFVLRNSIEDEERRAVYAAAYSCIAVINAPISFAVTRLIPSASHPVVDEGAMAVSNLIPFLVAMAGMLMVGFAIYVARMTEERLGERLAALKEKFESGL